MATQKRVALLVGERHADESDRAVIACNDYLRMGPARSLRKLLKKSGKTRQNPAPTNSLHTLEEWSAAFDWQDRASAYDADREDAKTERRRKEMEVGLALDYERVGELKRLAKLLKEQLFARGNTADTTDGADTPNRVTGRDYPNLWVADVKQIGAGEYAERVDLVRFNSALVEQFRAALADLAAETGGRRQKVDHAVANIDYSRLSDDQLRRIAAGEDPIQVILSGYIGQGQGGS